MNNNNNNNLNRINLFFPIYQRVKDIILPINLYLFKNLKIYLKFI